MNYKYINGAQVFTLEDKKDKQNFRLVKYTENTWQPDRDKKELFKNTEQGKYAERALALYIQEYSGFVYISYDDFRTDDQKKHAPFDGLLYNEHLVDELSVKSFIAKINKEIEKGPKFGKISVGLRKELKSSGIYTVEIKSTKIWNSILNKTDEETIEEIQSNDDFLAYPKFTRVNKDITSFSDYCAWVKKNVAIFNKTPNQILSNKIIDKELENLSDIQIRIYTNTEKEKIYLMGYILKEDLFITPVIKKMSLRGKSNLPIYYALPIKNGKSLNLLFSDHRLWLPQKDKPKIKRAI